MRRKVIICDICGEEISKGDARIKAKIRAADSWDNEGYVVGMSKVEKVRHMYTLP